MEEKREGTSFIKRYDEDHRDELEEITQKQIEDIETSAEAEEIKQRLINNKIRRDENFQRLSEDRGDKNYFLVLAEYNEKCGEGRYWEIFKNREEAYKWIKDSMSELDLYLSQVVSETLSFVDSLSAGAFLLYCLESGKIEDPGFDPRDNENLAEDYTIEDGMNKKEDDE